MPKPAPRITFAVLRPMPGTVTRSSMRGGTSPPNCSTSVRLAAMMRRALVRKGPVALGGKKLARRGRDLPALGATCEARAGFLHHGPKGLRTVGLQLRDDRADLRFHLSIAQTRRHVAAQDRHLLLLAARGLVTSGFTVNVDRLLASLHLFACHAHDEVVVDRAGHSRLLARPHNLALQERKRAQSVLVAFTPRVDHFGFKSFEK